LIVARTLHYASTALLEGSFVFWCLIARPAFRRLDAGGGLETRFDRKLLTLCWGSWIVAVISGIGWLLSVGSHMSGVPLSSVVSGGVVNIVLTQTRFGQDWTWRGVLAIVLAACLLAQTRGPRQLARRLGLVGAAALVASIIWAGHGAAADDLPFDFLHFPADLLHLLATGAWLGALVPLALFLAEVRRDPDVRGLLLAGMTSQRFSTLGVTCVGILVVTGIVNTWFLSGSIPALVGTLYGRLLLLKVAIFIGMIGLAGMNHNRLVPFLAQADGEISLRSRAVRELSLNVASEASLGIFVLGIVGIIGVLAPGLHTEPNWPFPFRLDLGEVAVGAQKIFELAAVLFVISLAVCLIAVGRRRYRGMAASLVGIVVFGSIAGVTVRPGMVRAYPTTYYAPTQAYAAPSISRGGPLYAANCTVCHGVNGRGDGPLASRLPIRPADLTEEHIFAHNVGDLFWWIGHGKGGVMPGFAGTLTPEQRWDVINFVLARAAAVQANDAPSQITGAAAPPIPDFAFEQNGAQNTLSQTLKGGPVLLVLFSAPAPRARLEQLQTLEPRLAAEGLRIIAVGLGESTETSPLVFQITPDVRATLGLFRSARDGGETELMLDRNAGVRARWTVSQRGGLAGPATLLADATQVARIRAAAANHAGHGG
jgi:putative copper export protein/mono/diheme cytochrome c family protein